MNCQNCSIEIPPTWTAALTANVCPACGQPIMGEEIQTLIKDLSEALKVMPANAEAIAGWVVSNYKLTKIASYDPSQVQAKDKKQNKPQGNNGGGNIAKSGVITATDLLKQAKTGIDPDEIMQRAYEARNNIPPPIVEDEFDTEIEEDVFDAEAYSQKQLARVMGKMQSAPIIEDQPMSKQLVIEANRTYMKQQEAKEAILSEAPKKNGFCRAG